MGVLYPSDRIITTATARNKKVSEQEASRLALEQLEPSLNEEMNTKGISPKVSPKPSPKPSPKLMSQQKEQQPHKRQYKKKQLLEDDKLSL